MAKFLRPGKVVVVLNGRFAGKKAVIVKNTYRFLFFVSD
jgi:large subunit ribosomal protein L27e